MKYDYKISMIASLIIIALCIISLFSCFSCNASLTFIIIFSFLLIISFLILFWDIKKIEDK